jgi:assimilatory nitrate reductase catalytic subunit
MKSCQPIGGSSYTTVLLQTITDIEGEGIDSPQDLNLTYSILQGCTAGVQYVRAGNTTEGMINITVLNDGKAMRYMPVAAGSAIHVPLSIVDELQPGTEISIAAAAERSGKLILDVGILEVNTS